MRWKLPSAIGALSLIVGAVVVMGQGGVSVVRQAPGTVTAGHMAGWADQGVIKDIGAVPSGSTGANPTATIGTSAVNGTATTFMPSDAAPAIPQCSSSTFGACKVDGSTITATAGVISAAGGSSGISGLTATQVPLAGSATTLTSSFALGTGVQTFLTTPSSANLASALTDETGSGVAVFGTSPSLTTPTIAGATLSGTLAGSPTFSGVPILSGLSSGTCSNGLSLDSGNHVVTVSCPAGSGLSGMTTGQVPLAGSASTITSSFALGTGVQTFLTTPSSANLATALTDETGSGAAVFGTSPALGTPAITGGTLAGITAFGLRDTSAAFDLTLAATSSTALTAGRALTFDVVNAGRTVKLGSNLTIASDPGGVTGAMKSNGTGTFAQAACTDLSNGATGCSTATGTSGATIPLLNGANTWSGVQSFNDGDLSLKGSSSGTLVMHAAAAAGSGVLTFPAGTTDFSATGGTSQFLKQASAGAAITVARPACADLSDSVASCSALPTVPQAITWVPGINPNGAPIFRASATRTITAIVCRPEVAAGGAATIAVYKAPSGTAISAGTILHSGTCNANGTAATDQTLTLVGGATDNLASGDTVGIVTTGTTVWTSSGVALGAVTVYIQ